MRVERPVADTHRRADPVGVTLEQLHGPHRPPRRPPCTLTDDEGAAMLALLNSPAYRESYVTNGWGHPEYICLSSVVARCPPRI